MRATSLDAARACTRTQTTKRKALHVIDRLHTLLALSGAIGWLILLAHMVSS